MALAGIWQLLSDQFWMLFLPISFGLFAIFFFFSCVDTSYLLTKNLSSDVISSLSYLKVCAEITPTSTVSTSQWVHVPPDTLSHAWQ